MTSSSTPPVSGTSVPSTAVQTFCAACGSALGAGARFCHRCGTPVGQGAPALRTTGGNAATVLPWAVAFVALLALVAMFAGRNFGSARGSRIDGSSNSLPTSELDGAAAAAGGFGGAAPDIANLSPSDRASRLFVRIMTYAERGQADSVAFFAPMAIGAHEMLATPDIDERYHFGLIGEVTGNTDVARAQADTILSQRPTSLLGLMLAAKAARMAGDEAAARAFDQRFLDAMPAELASSNEHYTLHRAEIDRTAAALRNSR